MKLEVDENWDYLNYELNGRMFELIHFDKYLIESEVSCSGLSTPSTKILELVTSFTFVKILFIEFRTSYTIYLYLSESRNECIA